jgi:hypothetical protein
MTHTETVNTETFQRLQQWQRHLVLKHDQLLMPGDNMAVREQDTRNELNFEIKSIEALHSRSDIVGLWAPYKDTVVSLIPPPYDNNDIPDTVG